MARAGPRGTAVRRAIRAETEKAARSRPEVADPAGLHQPGTRLRRLIEAAAAAARTEDEFFAGLAARGVAVQLRHIRSGPPRSPATPSACGPTPPARTAAPSGSAAASWPRTSPCPGSAPLAHRNKPPDRQGDERSNRQRLTRRSLRAARASRTEQEFFAELTWPDWW